MNGFRLRFPLAELQKWVPFYTHPEKDIEPMRAGEQARRNGFLTRDQFLTIARWKSPRPLQHYQRNDELQVQETTRLAFSDPDDSGRLISLCSPRLHGVQQRTASCILHLCHADRYPMMDVKACWSAGLDRIPAAWLSIWPAYTAFCRNLAEEAEVDMRTLDRALWGFANANGGQMR